MVLSKLRRVSRWLKKKKTLKSQGKKMPNLRKLMKKSPDGHYSTGDKYRKIKKFLAAFPVMALKGKKRSVFIIQADESLFESIEAVVLKIKPNNPKALHMRTLAEAKIGLAKDTVVIEAL